MGVASGKPVLSKDDCAYIANQTLTMPSEVKIWLLYHLLLAIRPSGYVSKKYHLYGDFSAYNICPPKKKEMGIKTKQNKIQYSTEAE